jgi:hypothetical protein
MTAAPLTNEDVVRMAMTGTPERAILERIAGAAVDFDLDPDTVRELREAGVSGTVLEAMQRRQAAMPPRVLPPSPPPPAGASGTIEVVFEASPGARRPAERSAVALAALPPGLERRGGQEVAAATDMAFALLCLTAEHVPDHWDARTPLATAPRHEMLLFRPGSARARMRGFDILYLDRADSYSAAAASGRHRLLMAAAVRQSGSGAWRILASDEAAVTVTAGGTTRVTLRASSRLRGSFMKGFDLESEWKVTAVEPPGAAAAPAGEAA